MGFKDYKQKTAREKVNIDADERMTQIFGQEIKREIRIEPNKERLNVDIEDINIPEKIKIEKFGFLLVSLIFLIQGIVFIIDKNWKDVFGSVMFSAIFALTSYRLKFDYNEILNHYLANATITLKALFHNLKFTSNLMVNSKKILTMSILLMIVQRFILSKFLLTPISSSLFSIGYYGMYLGGILCFANRQTKALYNSLIGYSLFQLVLILTNGFGGSYRYINYHTVITLLVCLTLACAFKHCNIKDIQNSKGEN